LPVGPAELDCHVISLDISGLPEAIPEGEHIILGQLGGRTIEEPNDRNRPLLGARSKRPCRCTTNEPESLSPSHRITSPDDVDKVSICL
jgi:hypothetical protein